jgi:fatty acid-binding protein DegV
MSSKPKVAVVTDGTCSITPEQGEGFGLHVVPVYVMFGEQSYLAGVKRMRLSLLLSQIK